MLSVSLALFMATRVAVAARGAQTQPSPAEARAPSAPRATDAAEDTGETVVRVRRRRRAVAATRTSSEEARRLPGTQGDAVRVVESLPGIGRPSFGSGELLVWGASPQSSRILIDGVPIPLLFHGSGLRSTLNGFFVQNIDLVPGGYGAEFGRATAGVVSIETAPLREGTHANVGADLLDASGAASAQMSQHVFGAAGLRYGYIDRLVTLVASPSALQYISVPQYMDYQARIEYHPDAFTRASLMVFGSLDANSNVLTATDPTQARSLFQRVGYHRIVGRYVTRTADDAQVSVTAWGGLDENSRTEQFGPYPTMLNSHVLLAGVRASWLRTVLPWARVHAGIDVEVSHSDEYREGSLLDPPREGDVYVFGQPPAGDLNADAWGVDQLSAAPFIELPLGFLHDRLTVLPGLRLDATAIDVSRALPPQGDTPSHGVDHAFAHIEPRLSAAWRVTDSLLVKAAFGVYHQAPQAADLSSVFGNPTLGMIESFQYVVGASYQFTNAISFEAIGFYRNMDGVVSRALPGQLQAGAALVQDGTAQAYGLQLTLRHTLAHGLTGWIAYTLSRSEVTDHPGEAARLSDYDQTHLLTAVSSYEIGYGISVGLRARFISGLPRTPVIGRYYDALSGDFQPEFGAVNSTRLPFITSVDVRIDKRIRLGSTNALVYLDVLNVLNQPAAEEIVYDTTYTQHAYITGLPILADLGARVEF